MGQQPAWVPKERPCRPMTSLIPIEVGRIVHGAVCPDEGEYPQTELDSALVARIAAEIDTSEEADRRVHIPTFGTTVVIHDS